MVALGIEFLRMAEYLSVLALFMHHALVQLRPQGRRIAAIDGGNYGVLSSTKVTQPLHLCKETNTHEVSYASRQTMHMD